MDFEFSIEKQIAVIKKHDNGWTKELNLVSWNGADPKYDIRDWAPNHSHMSRGCTFFREEAEKLFEALKTEFGGDDTCE